MAMKTETSHSWEHEAEGKLKGLVLLEDESFDPIRVIAPHVDKLAPVVPAGRETQCIGRMRFDKNTEQQLNNMINVEYSLSYAFHSMSNYFARDCVALPGLAALFLKRSTETRANAIRLSSYMSKRGGCTVLKNIPAPPGEYNNEEKGDALFGMELALSMEKVEMEKLMALNKAAEDVVDEQLSDYITDEFLDHQVDLVNQHALYVSQLRRVGKGHGQWDWDRNLAKHLEISPTGLPPVGGRS